MAKKKSRGGESSEETLRGKNRELQKEIRQLQQQVKQLEKQLGLRSSFKEDKSETKKREPDPAPTCEVCGKGEMEQFTFKAPHKTYIFWKCGVCKNSKKGK